LPKIHSQKTTPTNSPIACPAKYPPNEEVEMLANVSVKDLAIVTAGFAKEVEEVNQYPAVIYRPTAIGMWSSFLAEIDPKMVNRRPKVATLKR
jgi:hypothetical protein